MVAVQRIGFFAVEGLFQLLDRFFPFNGSFRGLYEALLEEN